MLYVKIKRLLDILLALIGLIIFAPVLIMIALAIKLSSRGAVLFKQKRVGIHQSHFYIVKFRTMRIDTPQDTPTHLLENPDEWITGIGRFLRKTSLDELPQIWNVLVGQMSIVGPRPALWNQDDLIAERDKYGANDLRPGLTGWAQINGRDELSIEMKAKLDGEYVRRMGFCMDVRCFLGTIACIVKGHGFTEGGVSKEDIHPKEITPK